MGLQFVDANGTERTLTVEDMKTPAFQDAYSDLYKELNGFRPRCTTSPEQMLRFFDSYEDEFEAQAEQEREALARASERDGIQYRDWSHYYDCKEQRDFEEWRREDEARKAREAVKMEMRRRFSPLPVIEDWMYGLPA
jgi:hypothetical protein